MVLQYVDGKLVKVLNNFYLTAYLSLDHIDVVHCMYILVLKKFTCLSTME